MGKGLDGLIDKDKLLKDMRRLANSRMLESYLINKAITAEVEIIKEELTEMIYILWDYRSKD